MTVVEIRNNEGYRLGAIRFETNNEDGEVEVNEFTDNIYFNGYKFDDNFEAIESGNDNGLEAMIKQIIEDYEEEDEEE